MMEDPQGDQSLQALAEQVALSEVQQLFSDPIHLEELDKIREEYQRKLIATETQLEAGVQAQLDEMQNAAKLLSMAKDEMRQVQQRFVAVNDRCRDCTHTVGNFEYITKVRNARVNLNEILQQLEIYDAIPKRVKELRMVLDQDQQTLRPVFMEWVQLNTWRTRILAQVSDAITEAGKKEEDIKERLANWEEIDSSQVLPSWGQSAEVQSRVLLVLGDHFRRVEELGEYIWELIAARLACMFDNSRDPSFLVTAVELVERLDKHDDRERSRRKNLGEPIEKLEMLMPPGKHRKQALEVLESTIENRVNSILNVETLKPDIDDATLARLKVKYDKLSRKQAQIRSGVKPQDDSDEDDSEDDSDDDNGQQPFRLPESKLTAFMNSTSNLILDLQELVENITKLFPESYNIFALYRWVLERRILELLQPVWNAWYIGTGERLKLIDWLDYYVQFIESMSARHGQATITASGLDASSPGERASLSKRLSTFPTSSSSFGALTGKGSVEEDFRAAAAARLREFKRQRDTMMDVHIQGSLSRLRQSMKTIISKNNTPEVSTQGSLRTAMPQDILFTLNEEVAILFHAEVGGHQMASFIQKVVFEILNSFQRTLASQISDESQEVSIEWCCAFMNDCERMYDICDSSIGVELKRWVENGGRSSEGILTDLHDELDVVAGGFMRGVDLGSKRIVQEMFKDINKKGVLDAFFTNSWENGSMPCAATLRVTFFDFFNNPEIGLRVWLSSELLFGKTVALTLNELIDLYVVKLMERTAPFQHRGTAVQRMRNDANVFEECFTHFLDVLRFGKIRDRQVLSSRLHIIRKIADILDDDYPQNHFEEVAAEFGTFAQQAISRLLFYRGDLSFEEREDLKLYDVSEYTADSTARFDLSRVAPLHESPDGDAAVPEDPAAKKKRSKLRKKMKSALQAVKLQNKNKKKSEGLSQPTQQAATVMSLDEFLS